MRDSLVAAMENGQEKDPLPLELASDEDLARAERAVLARGETVENLDWVAFMYFSHRKAPQAIVYYKRLCEQAPGNASYHWYLGEALWQILDKAGAREQWERVMQLDRGEYAKLAAARLAGP